MTVFIGGGCSAVAFAVENKVSASIIISRGEGSLDHARGAAKNISIEHMGEDFERGCFLEL